MLSRNEAHDARTVMRAFMDACDAVSTAEQLRDWQGRHPDLAQDLADLAEAMSVQPVQTGEFVYTADMRSADDRLLDGFHDLMGIMDPDEHRGRSNGSGRREA